MAQISPRLARTYFAEISAGSALPLDPDDLVHMVRRRQHGHVVIGDSAIRCYKNKSKWTYDERDIRRAAQAFADFRLDLDDVVEICLPPYRDHAERDQEERGRPDWRETIASWMYWYACQKHREQRRYEDWNDSWQRIGVHGLPGDLTWDEFMAAHSGRRQSIANTRPLELITRSDSGLFIPRAYVELLDRWEQVTEDLVAQARICSRCRAQGPRWGAWRSPTPLGYVTLCPPCSGATFQRYTGHLRGVLYGSARTQRTRADGYLCRLCSESRAAVWDHCHDHGLVRGPLCGSCNTYEGKSTPQSFLHNKEGAALHLLECRGCREQRTLPARYHAAFAQMYVEAAERHIIRARRCKHVPWIEHVELAQGTYRFELSCWWHKAMWTKDVTVAETAALVKEFVDQALAAEQAGASIPAPRHPASDTTVPA
ncbi:endonuclease VII domain-containing protein [Streptomyces sp. NBC_01789]|uniref:endonuclease VII domain-containing protein n=1 Tax=Streptomyces sp. NBC_01789 TaxID=2975941 RepID=UPI00224FC54D|nr:endonuclease VII domain-containing protein [Streptomyces sp. NBC_01789]MCX4444841.1 endonuclease VII domain-containing protein [Streptomyces sp. NBC_01789]